MSADPPYSLLREPLPSYRAVNAPSSLTPPTTPVMGLTHQANGEAADPLICEDGYVFMFAFGSNMDPAVLSGRRKCFPVLSLPCSVPNWSLRFSVPGLPYVEPG